jgi:hypothetical protein
MPPSSGARRSASEKHEAVALALTRILGDGLWARGSRLGGRDVSDASLTFCLHFADSLPTVDSPHAHPSTS